MKIEAAYLAGLFDGEGTVQIQWAGNGRGGKSFRVLLQIGNTYAEVLHRIQRDWGGKVYQVTKPQKHSRLKPSIINFCGEEADRLAAAMLPHSVIKREQLEIFQRARAEMRRQGSGVPLTLAERERRDILAAELKTARLAGVQVWA